MHTLALLLTVHLGCAATATLLFWVAASARKGGSVHRAAGRWFARLVYATAITGGAMASARLFLPVSLLARASGSDQMVVLTAGERQMMWLVLYVLLIIVAPVQHGLAVVRAASMPPNIRSHRHAVLTFGAMLGSLAIIPAALLWQQWLFLIVGPIGLIVGLRHLRYATLRSATRLDWEREHLTSMIVAGVTLHTALLVFGATRTLGLSMSGAVSLVPWTMPAVLGLPVLVWLRRTRRPPVASD